MTNNKAKEIEIGDRMQDGTVIIAVDPESNAALFAPEGIFGGKSDFKGQDEVVTKANDQDLLGHKDWRRITEWEAEKLANIWDKVAPPALQGAAAPFFWSQFASSSYRNGGHGFRGGSNQCYSACGTDLYQVPVVRSGPVPS